MDLLQRKKRVFWHEFGHFTAAFYNKKYYGKYGTESIFIIKCDYYGEVDFKGEHNPVKPPNYSNSDPIKHPASLVASIVYGCYLQSLFLNTELDSCLNKEMPGVHGFDDYNKLSGLSFRFGMNSEKKEDLFKLISDQFNVIRNGAEFSHLFKNDVNDLINSDVETTYIDPKELETRFQQFLQDHEDTYKAFVENLAKAFENHHCIR